MADDTRVLKFLTEIDSSGMQSGAASATSDLDSISGSASGVGSALAGLKPIAIEMGAQAAAMAAQWAIAGIDMAADAERIAASFEETFGRAAAELNEGSDDVREAVGLSTAELQKLQTSMGQTAKAIGLSESEAAIWVDTATRAAVDAAIFNNEVEKAPQYIEAMEKALGGNYSALSRLGVQIDKSMVQQQAMAETGKTSTKQLTDEDMAAAALSLTLQQLTDETGAMAEATEEGSLKQQEFDSKMKDVQTSVGGALLPLKELLLDVLLLLIPVLEALNPLFESLGAIIKVVTAILGPFVDIIGFAIKFLSDLSNALYGLFSPVARLGDYFSNLSSKIRSAFSWTPPSWMRNLGIAGFHSGGTVPGAPGSEQLIRAQGGERVVPSSGVTAMDNNGGGATYNITVNSVMGDPMEIGRQIQDILDEYARQNGQD